MSTVKPEYRTLMAAAQDAGNRHMKSAGRVTWDESDWDFAADMLTSLYAALPLV